MQVTRIYTGDDGQSHFEDVEVELQSTGAAGLLSEPVATRSVIFRQTGADYDLDFHPAPRRQYVVNLTGRVELETGSGDKRILGGGEILLAEDTTGQGHKSKAVGDEPRQCLFITLE
jgi:hypothetical protein|tara:strand:- start:2423 stop:2773 length:351 start_codon:yes stop_codon:yes gene_type:complete